MNSQKKKSPTDFSSMIYGKIPPQAKDLEEALLGACMLESSAIITVMEFLKPECFYMEAHQKIFSAMLRLERKMSPIDILTVINELKTSEDIELVGGEYYIAKLTNMVTSTANMETWARIIIQKWAGREAIRISGEVIDGAYDDSVDSFDLLDQWQAQIEQVNDFINGVNTSNYQHAVMKRGIDILSNDGSKPPGILTGFITLDRILLSLFPQLYVIAARPSMGKTAFLLQLVDNISKKDPVGVIELETVVNSFVDRHFANKTGIDSMVLKRGGLSEDQGAAVKSAMEDIINQNIIAEFIPGLDVYRIKAKARAWKRKHKIKILFVDYLQIIATASEDERKNREQQVARMTNGLAALSIELQIPVVAFAQLSREVLKRGDKRPNLGDLRESGGIEAAARCVMFIHRPEYYDELEDEQGNSTKGIAEIIVAKNNEGKLGTARLRFAGHLSKFSDDETDLFNVGGGYKAIVDSEVF